LTTIGRAIAVQKRQIQQKPPLVTLLPMTYTRIKIRTRRTVMCTACSDPEEHTKYSIDEQFAEQNIRDEQQPNNKTSTRRTGGAGKQPLPFGRQRGAAYTSNRSKIHVSPNGGQRIERNFTHTGSEHWSVQLRLLTHARTTQH
jgi:hypothetical protein